MPRNEKRRAGGQKRQTILVASHDAALADVRKQVLDEAGFDVVPARDMNTVNDALAKRSFDLVMIGYSLPPAERRRIMNAVRAFDAVPILQLIRGGRHELYKPDRHIFEESATPDDFLRAVKSALGLPY